MGRHGRGGQQGPAGQYDVTARVTDRAGNTTELTRPLVLDSVERAQLTLPVEDGGGQGGLLALVSVDEGTTPYSVGVRVGDGDEVAATWDEAWASGWPGSTRRPTPPATPPCAASSGGPTPRAAITSTAPTRSRSRSPTTAGLLLLSPYNLPLAMALADPDTFSPATFYLYYQDRSGISTSTMSVRDADGAVVRDDLPGAAQWSWYGPFVYWTWDGRDDDGAILASGTYTLEMTVKDTGGNASTYQHQVNLDRAEPLQWEFEPVEGSSWGFWRGSPCPRTSPRTASSWTSTGGGR